MRGKEQAITVGGKNYRLSKLTIKIWHRFTEWVNEKLGNPFDDIKGLLPGLPIETQKLLIDHAQAKRLERRAVDSPEVQAEARTVEGSIEFLTLMLAENHKELTREQLRLVAWDYLEETGEQAMFKALADAEGTIYVEEVEAEKSVLAQMGKWDDGSKKV